jgi:hypothetical protein
MCWLSRRSGRLEIVELNLGILVTYLSRIAPALALGGVLLILARRARRMRIVIYLALFILLRDAMTPLGLWSLGTEGFFWLRLAEAPGFLVVFGLGSFAMTVGMAYLDKPNRTGLRWIRGHPVEGGIVGLIGASVVALPLVLIYRSTPIELRGGTVPTRILPALLIFALLGNFLEETLFRGYVLEELALTMPSMKAGVFSGVVFAFCHIYLATTVTDTGSALLLFTLWEGILAGVIGSRYGILPATLTHGGAIFLLASGLF